MARKRAKGPTISASGGIPKVTLSMPLDPKRIKAIQRCIAKGTLKITISKVDLATGRIGDGWIYD